MEIKRSTALGLIRKGKAHETGLVVMDRGIQWIEIARHDLGRTDRYIATEIALARVARLALSNSINSADPRHEGL